jgi:dsRNA-specific ribonuclease
MIPKKAPNNDPITQLKELAESGRIKDLKYEEIGQNPFAFKCSVYFGPKPFQSTGESTTKKGAKRSAAAAMIEELKCAKVIC